MQVKLCKTCGKPITGRSDKEFCSPNCKYVHWRDCHADEVKNNEVTWCFYCGLQGSTIDHIPPKTVRDRLTGLGMQSRFKFIEVYCCYECNCLLGARPIWTPETRKRYIKKALQKRYRKILTTPIWNDSELRVLGPTLNQYIIGKVILADLIRRRINW